MDGGFDLTFPSGDSLAGKFHFVVGSDTGTLSEVNGMWQGMPVQAPAEVSASAAVEVSTATFVNISFRDDQKSLWFGPTMAGGLVAGPYTMPYEAWVDLQWTPTGGTPLQVMDTSGGSLTITELSESGIAGTYSASFTAGGTIRGRFDVPF